MYLWCIDLIEIYIGIYLNDLHNRWYHRVGDIDANKQRMEVELIE